MRLMRSPEKSTAQKLSAGERGLTFFRNINALGALAFYGAGVAAPALAVPLNVLAGINAVQAGGFEVVRRWAHKRKAKILDKH